MPGSYLNGAEGRTIPKTNNIGPTSAEEAYNSHEYYNHDKVLIILIETFISSFRFLSMTPSLIAIICESFHQWPA
jgi:hypothetical protein